MDPISAGAMKQVHQSVFEQAEQQIKKSNEQISDFEKLREKLEQQDAISNQQQQQTNPLNKTDQTQQTDQVNQSEQINTELNVQKAGEIPNTQAVPKIKDMDQLEGMVGHIRSGQARLNQIISDATSGKTYSPQEMLAMQAEVSKITQELQTATSVVKDFVEGAKQVLGMQL